MDLFTFVQSLKRADFLDKISTHSKQFRRDIWDLTKHVSIINLSELTSDADYLYEKRDELRSRAHSSSSPSIFIKDLLSNPPLNRLYISFRLHQSEEIYTPSGCLMLASPLSTPTNKTNLFIICSRIEPPFRCVWSVIIMSQASYEFSSYLETETGEFTEASESGVSVDPIRFTVLGSLLSIFYCLMFDSDVCRIRPLDPLPLEATRWKKWSGTYHRVIKVSTVKKHITSQARTVEEGRELQQRLAHWRVGHYRRLSSDWYKNSKDKLMYINPCWVGPTDFAIDDRRYQILLDRISQ